jgi:hypothetical protein
MRTVTVEARAAAAAATAFTALTRFESFQAAERDGLSARALWQDGPSRLPDLASVSVQPGPQRVSAWAIRFRDGLIRWQQRDDCDPRALTIGFGQTAGDFGSWRGSWRVSAIPEGCHIVFEARFDIGVPMLGQLVEPCAGQVVARSVAAILTGLFPRARLMSTPAADHDPEAYIWSLLATTAATRGLTHTHEGDPRDAD